MVRKSEAAVKLETGGSRGGEQLCLQREQQPNHAHSHAVSPTHGAGVAIPQVHCSMGTGAAANQATHSSNAQHMGIFNLKLFFTGENHN